jgi:membrane protein
LIRFFYVLKHLPLIDKLKKQIKERIFPFTKDLVNEIVKDDCFNMSAALAYYTTFSLAPTLIILIAIGGFFLEKQTVRRHIYEYVAQLTTDLHTADLVQSLLDNISFSAHGLTVTIVSGVTVLIGATTVFAVLHSSLNKIWNVSIEKRSGVLQLLLQRLVSLLAIFVIGILLIAALIVQAFINTAYQFVQDFVPLPDLLVHLFDGLLPLAILYLFFVMIFKLLSDAKLRWRHVFLGAMVTSLLLWFGRWLISLYLSNTSVGSVYGTAASLATLLIWVYYSSLMVFIGAEFMKVYAWATHTDLDLNDTKRKQQAKMPVTHDVARGSLFS